MPNASVHFPEGMLDELDRLAAAAGVSRGAARDRLPQGVRPCLRSSAA